MKQGVQNGLEKFEGVLEGPDLGRPARSARIELDKKVKDWAAQPGHEAHKAGDRQARADPRRGACARRASTSTAASRSAARACSSTSLSLTRWAEERAKPDADRKPGYQDRDMPRALAGQKQFAKQYDRTLDRASFRLALVRALKLPEADRPWLATLLDAKKGTKIDEALIDKTLDAWYGDAAARGREAAPRAARRRARRRSSRRRRIRSCRPRSAIWPIYKAEEKKDDARAGELLLVTPFYAEAMREVLGGLLAPDANSTLRITYGTVKSFKPTSKERGGLAVHRRPRRSSRRTPARSRSTRRSSSSTRSRRRSSARTPTRRSAASCRSTSSATSTSPAATRARRRSTTRASSSGSRSTARSRASPPTSCSTARPTRTIHVDARYMLWTMDLLDGADHLIQEMGIKPQL